NLRHLPSFPTRRSSDLLTSTALAGLSPGPPGGLYDRLTWWMEVAPVTGTLRARSVWMNSWWPFLGVLCLLFFGKPLLINILVFRSEEHTSELQSLRQLV